MGKLIFFKPQVSFSVNQKILFYKVIGKK